MINLDMHTVEELTGTVRHSIHKCFPQYLLNLALYIQLGKQYIGTIHIRPKHQI